MCVGGIRDGGRQQYTGDQLGGGGRGGPGGADEEDEEYVEEKEDTEVKRQEEISEIRIKEQWKFTVSG